MSLPAKLLLNTWNGFGFISHAQTEGTFQSNIGVCIFPKNRRAKGFYVLKFTRQEYETKQ
jgi:hypothetical protein